MEVIRVVWSERKVSARERKRRRDAVVFALSKLYPYGSRTGIFGYEVCQVCGEIGKFSGLAGAQGSHAWYVQRNAASKKRGRIGFVASGHRHESAQGDPGLRFCEICRASGHLEEMTPRGHHLLCGECRKAFSRHAAEEVWDKMLNHFVRERRYYHPLIEIDERGLTPPLPSW
jgi:hypothetical protein